MSNKQESDGIKFIFIVGLLFGMFIGAWAMNNVTTTEESMLDTFCDYQDSSYKYRNNVLGAGTYQTFDIGCEVPNGSTIVYELKGEEKYLVEDN